MQKIRQKNNMLFMAHINCKQFQVFFENVVSLYTLKWANPHSLLIVPAHHGFASFADVRKYIR